MLMSNKNLIGLFLTLVLGVFSCQSGQHEITDKPADLLNRKEMAMILSDIHIAEAGVATTTLAGDSLIQRNLDDYALLFKKNGVDEKQFRASYTYYLSRPAELDSIYQEVLAKLNHLEATHQPGFQKQPDAGVSTGDTVQAAMMPAQ